MMGPDKRDGLDKWNYLDKRGDLSRHRYVLDKRNGLGIGNDLDKIKEDGLSR